MLGYLILAAVIIGAVAYAASPTLRVKANGYKTMAVSAAIAALGVLQQADLTTVFSDKQTVGFAVIGIGVAMAILRALTNGPVGGD